MRVVLLAGPPTTASATTAHPVEVVSLRVHNPRLASNSDALAAAATLLLEQPELESVVCAQSLAIAVASATKGIK
jgi:hypothetical protein